MAQHDGEEEVAFSEGAKWRPFTSAARPIADNSDDRAAEVAADDAAAAATRESQDVELKLDSGPGGGINDGGGGGSRLGLK